MIIINKPENEIVECKCYKCGAIIRLHPMSNMNAPYVTDCELHNNDSKLPEFVVELLRPIADAQMRINEIILELLPKYYTKDSEENSTDE